MMKEDNLLNRNSTSDIQGVKLTHALVILISYIERENQLSNCGSTILIDRQNRLMFVCTCYQPYKMM